MKGTKWQNPPLHLTESRSPQWYIRYRDAAGVVQREYFGHKSEVSKHKALKAKNDFVYSINAPKKRTAKFQGTFREFYEQIYKVERLDPDNLAMKETSRQNLQMVIETRILTAAFADYQMEEIGLADVNAWLRGLKDLAPSTRKTTLSILSMVFRYAIAHRAVEFNPCQVADVGRGGKAREKKFFGPAELDKIMAGMARHTGAPLVLMTRFSLATGLRISEILGLRWENVNFLAGTFDVRERYCMSTFDTPKNTAAASGRVIAATLLPELVAWRSRNMDKTFVFESPRRPGVPYSYQGVQAMLRTAAEECGLYYPGFGWHAWRRVCSTVGIEEFGGTVASKHVGKASAESMDRYYIKNKEKAQEVADRIADRILGPLQ